MLSTDNIIWQDTGSFESSSGTVTHPDAGGTTAGNAVVIIVGLGGDDVAGHDRDIAAPSGFSEVSAIGSGPTVATLRFFIKPSASAGETSWGLTVTGGSEQVCWAMFEMTGLDLDWPNKAYLNAGSTQPTNPAGSPVTSQACLTATGNESYAALGFAAAFVTNTTPTAPTVTGWSDGFFEIATESIANGSRAHVLSVAAQPIQVTGDVDTTVSLTPASHVSTWLVVFTGTESLHAVNPLGIFGAEIGTDTGLTVGDQSGGPAPWDTSTGSPTIVTTFARSGTYCIKYSSTSAACNTTWEQKTAPQRGTLGTVSATALPAVVVKRLHVYFDGALPSGDTQLASCEVGSLANGLQIRYVSASQKIGVKIGTGTEQVSDTTVTHSQHIGIDYFYDPRTTTHLCDWAVDYNANVDDVTPGVAQTRASTAGMTAGGITKIRTGWTDAVTRTVYMDDMVASQWRKTYPIGDVRIVPLKVDPAGTHTVLIDANNFRTFTSNGGTLTAITSANIRTALDDIPPTIGSTADGLTQITVDTGDYVMFPMEPYTCAPDFSPVTGRWYVAGWAASGNPAAMKYEMYDGTSFGRTGSDDPGFDTSATVWLTSLHRPNTNIAHPLTVARLSNLAIRMGYSPDANPDGGFHSVLFELVLKPADTIGVIDCETGAFMVYARINPVTQAIVSFLVTTPSGDRGATFTHSLAEVAQDPHYVDPNTAYELSIGADDISGVTAYGLSPDPA